MKTIKGPAIFLAQFLSDEPPFNTLDGICQWVSELGYKGIQLPTDNPKIIDLQRAAESKDYCDEVKGKIANYGLQITELSTHLQGQLIAVHPAYHDMFDAFAPEQLKGKPEERTAWAMQQLKYAGSASRNLGLTAHASFSGSLAWPYMYPWPQRPQGLIDTAFKALSKRWTPILNHFDECGVDLCYELHPCEDLHDGISYEMFLDYCNEHERACILYDPSHFVLQQLDYCAFIDIYHERIKMFHVKDAEFNPNGKQGVYGGYQNWENRAGRFRSPGDGQVDFKRVFSLLSHYNFDGWAVLEWECCIKSAQQGAREGAQFITDHIIDVTSRPFDDFAASTVDRELINRNLGL